MRSIARGVRLPAAFWGALVVLVLNDHVLKGSGLLPGVVTGKLSDFAGLVLAPLVLCAIFGARSDRARGVCIALIALPFAAIKLSPWAAGVLAETLSALVLRSRIWCDPTDLIALSVLPWTLRLARTVEPAVLGEVWPRRIAIAAAAVACTATSSGGPYEGSFEPPLLINWTLAPIDVVVSMQRATCDGTAAAITGAVQYTLHLAPAYMAPLGWVEADADAGPDLDCRLVELQINGSSFRTFWSPAAEAVIQHRVVDMGFGSPTSYPSYQIESHDEWAFQRAFTVVGSPSAPQLVVGSLLDGQLLP
jgi:hypothetical protein